MAVIFWSGRISSSGQFSKLSTSWKISGQWYGCIHQCRTILRGIGGLPFVPPETFAPATLHAPPKPFGCFVWREGANQDAYIWISTNFRKNKKTKWWMRKVAQFIVCTCFLFIVLSFFSLGSIPEGVLPLLSFACLSTISALNRSQLRYPIFHNNSIRL